MIQRNGKVCFALELEKSILLNDKTIQGNLQIQYNPSQIMNGVFSEN